jgi:hypothetical protein
VTRTSQGRPYREDEQLAEFAAIRGGKNARSSRRRRGRRVPRHLPNSLRALPGGSEYLGSQDLGLLAPPRVRKGELGMAKMRCPKCSRRAAGRHLYCVACGTGLPGRAPVTKSASGYARAQHGPRPAVPWRDYLDAADPALRQMAEAQINKAAGTRPADAVPWRELIHDPDPALRILALDQVSKGIGA